MDSTIKRVAMELFVRKGYEATNIREICNGAGIEPPTVYYYFGSKKGLFLSVYKDIQQKLNDYFNHSIRLAEGESPRQRLFAAFKCLLQFTCSCVEDSRFLLRYSLFPPQELEEELIECTAEAEKPRTAYIREVLAECLGSGPYENVSPDMAEERLNLYIARCQYDIVFLNQYPDEDDMLKMWDAFVSCIPEQPQ